MRPAPVRSELAGALPVWSPGTGEMGWRVTMDWVVTGWEAERQVGGRHTDEHGVAIVAVGERSAVLLLDHDSVGPSQLGVDVHDRARGRRPQTQRGMMCQELSAPSTWPAHKPAEATDGRVRVRLRLEGNPPRILRAMFARY